MKLPPYLQRALLSLVALLIIVGVARLFVTMHQQDERISILESQVEALLADTTRLPVASSFHSGYSPRFVSQDRSYSSRRYRSKYRGSSRTFGSDTLYNNTREDSAAQRPVQASSSDRPHKFTEPHLFDLNTVDSLTLIRIPGIAARTASVILSQRQRYGGFYDVNQLRDFLTWDAARDYLDEWCTLWFTANADRLVRLPINTATVSQLQHHPYLSHQQAVEILQYRTRHNGFRQASELQQLSTLSPDEVTRLLPYLSF